MLILSSALNAGLVTLRYGFPVSLPLNLAFGTRVMAQAHGGQIVVSQSFSPAIGTDLPTTIELTSLGEIQLRGFETSEPLFEVASLRNN